jgi:hypothetical protein
MKTLRLVLIAIALHTGYSSNSQIEFTRQSQVDSFLITYDSSRASTITFRYDIGVPANDQIKDLSGFNNANNMVLTFANFEWEDIPWFESLTNGSISLINMPFIKSFSGLINFHKFSKFNIINCNNLKEISQRTIPGWKSMYALTIRDCVMDSLKIDFTGMSKARHNTLQYQRIDIRNTRIKHVHIWDPDLIASIFYIENDSAMQYLYIDGKKVGKRGGDIIGNSELEYLRGFKTCDNCRADIYDNPKLKDLCVLRDGLVKFYDGLSPKNIGSFRVYNNGPGASSIEDLRAADCSWLADTFTTVYETNAAAGGLKIYPNPTRGRFNIHAPSGKQIQKVSVYTLQGAAVPVKFEAGRRNVVEMDNPEKGMFILKVAFDGGDTETLKIVVEE